MPGWQIRNISVSEKLIVFFLDEQTGWIAGDNGTLLVTTDGGESWHQKYTLSSVNFTEVCFLNASTGFAAWYLPGLSLLYKTTDGGDSWQPVFQAPAGSVIKKVTVDFSGKIWLGGEGADVLGDPYGFLYASPDTGVTWNLVLDKGNGLTGVQDIDFTNANRGIVISCSLIVFTY